MRKLQCAILDVRGCYWSILTPTSPLTSLSFSHWRAALSDCCVTALIGLASQPLTADWLLSPLSRGDLVLVSWPQSQSGEGLAYLRSPSPSWLLAWTPSWQFSQFLLFAFKLLLPPTRFVMENMCHQNTNLSVPFFIRTQKSSSLRLSQLWNQKAKLEILMLHEAKEAWVSTIWF